MVHRLRETVPDLYFSVSMTTRVPRPGEENGVDYLYVSNDEFTRHVEAGDMLEWAEIHGGLQRSGTPAGPVRDAVDSNRPVLIEVDVEGARNVKKTLPEAHTVFLMPPSWEALVERLTGRGTEPPDDIERRLETAHRELAAKDEFDHIVVNDSVDNAVRAIAALLTAERTS